MIQKGYEGIVTEYFRFIFEVSHDTLGLAQTCRLTLGGIGNVDVGPLIGERGQSAPKIVIGGGRDRNGVIGRYACAVVILELDHDSPRGLRVIGECNAADGKARGIL